MPAFGRLHDHQDVRPLRFGVTVRESVAKCGQVCLFSMESTGRTRNVTEVELLHAWGCASIKDCLSFKDKSGQGMQ